MKIAIDINDTVRDNIYQFTKYYKRLINSDIDDEHIDVFSPNFNEVFPFESDEQYQQFVYLHASYELYGLADEIDMGSMYKLNNWINFEVNTISIDGATLEEPIEGMLVSPMEYESTIQATHYFLNQKGSRIREVYFPLYSETIWDRADILITANPKLLSTKPDGKYSIKIETSYNKESKGDYEFKSLKAFFEANPNEILKEIIKKEYV